MSKITDVVGIEVTDELIAINKKYKTLADLYDKYDEMIDAVRKANGLEFYQDNIDIKGLESQQGAIYKKMRKISDELSKDLFLSRMIKGAMMLKAISQVERESK